MSWLARVRKLVHRSTAADRAFNLSRWFALLASLAIGVTALVTAALLSSLFTDRMLKRDAELTASFVDAISHVDSSERLFAQVQSTEMTPESAEYFRHISSIQDALRINAFNRDGLIVWSTDPELIGQRFTDNDELVQALTGELVVNRGEALMHPKAEHIALESTGGPFVENYIPLWTQDRGSIYGVLEIYRVPTALFDAVRAGRNLIWAGAAGGGLLLFLVLSWAVRRADRIMFRQREQLLEAQTLATVGELSRAVAHSVRNPLASIRTSAEIELGAPLPADSTVPGTMRDIIGLVDRIDGLLFDMLAFSAPGAVDAPAAADLERVVRRTLDAFAQEFRRQRIEVRWTLPPGMPPVNGDERLLAQALASVMSNAVEAMPQGGRIEVAGEISGDRRAVKLSVKDSGIGMAPEQVARAFDPFYTNKARGLGVGLALVKRVVELSRGQIALSSTPGAGTTVDFTFRAAARSAGASA